MNAYLIEVKFRGRPSHDLCYTMPEALSKASCNLEAWILIDNMDPHYDPEAKAQVQSLLDEKRYAEAIEAWNLHCSDRTLAIHEVEITQRNCQHDPCPMIIEGVYYIVEMDSGDLGQEHCLSTGLNHALETVVYMMTRPPSHCDRATWKKVSRLLRLGKVADAMDSMECREFGAHICHSPDSSTRPWRRGCFARGLGYRATGDNGKIATRKDKRKVMNENKAKSIHDVRPSSLKHIIGQRQVVETIATTLDYCFQENVPFPHTLMLGPSGCGKTEICNVLANELACGLHSVLASAIKTPAEFFAVLMQAKSGDLVFFDELDTLSKDYMTALLVVTTERKIYIPNGSGGPPHAITLEPFTIIGATTEEYGILRPLAQRFALHCRYSHYSVGELAEIVRQRTKALQWPIDTQVLEAIAQRGKGVPRLALRLTQTCWRVCRAEGDECIMPKHLERACQLDGLDEIGLDFNEQRLLTLLEHGGLRLNVVATMLGLPAKTVSSVTEDFPLRNGLISKDRYGLRYLTDAGRQHLEKSRLKAV